MLKRIKTFYDENHEERNIEDEKIYWDTQRNQFRVKFYCNDCGKYIDCMCFDSLYTARTQIENGMICNDCGFERCIEEEYSLDIYYILDDKRRDKAFRYAIGKLTRTEFQKLIISNRNDKIIIGDIIEFLELDDREIIFRDYVIDLMTDKEKYDYFHDHNDEWANGESCNI